MDRELAQKTDTELAGLYERGARLSNQMRLLLVRLHRAVGDMKTRDLKRETSWQLTDQQALDTANIRLAAYAGNDNPVSPRDGRTAIVLLNMNQVQSELTAVNDRETELNKIYRSDPWSRFFLVTSSNGHIHSSMNCSSCYLTTTYGWLPALSGLTEAEAVAHEDGGPYLCQVCFPKARPEWCRSRPAPVDPAKVAARADRAARAAKKNLTTEETDAIGRSAHGDHITTVRAAEDCIREAVWLTNYGMEGKRHPTRADEAEAVALRAREVLLARGRTAGELDLIASRKLTAIRREIRQYLR